MATRKNISSGSPWEPIVGYSRAVRAGPLVVVAGTTATDQSGRVVSPKDAYLQAKYIFEKIVDALSRAGCSAQDVVRTRMYLKNISDWEKVARAHKEFFGSVAPAATMIQVSGFVGPEMLVEIEVDALAPS
jgi:enamine deaminase RidA (YjgF/YER057c/UK114 family)